MESVKTDGKLLAQDDIDALLGEAGLEENFKSEDTNISSPKEPEKKTNIINARRTQEKIKELMNILYGIAFLEREDDVRVIWNASETLPLVPGLNMKIQGIDLHVQPKTYITILKYDGDNFPFGNNEFDCVIMIDVLHHTKKPQKLLEEAKRVSRKYIVIKDHYWKNRIGFFILKISDYIGNKPYGVALPYNFLKLDEWHDLITQNALTIVKSKRFRFNMLDPCKNILFKLEL